MEHEKMSSPEDRMNMLYANVEHIEMAYLKGIESGIKEPVILALDLRDPIAKDINLASSGTNVEYVEKIIDEINKDNMIPTGYCILPRLDAYKLLSEIQLELAKKDSRNPEVSRVVEQLKSAPPKGLFYAIAFSFGKNIGLLKIP